MIKSKFQTVYLPTSDSNVELQVGKIDNKDYYKSFEKERDVYEKEGYFFTQEELNQLLSNVINQTLKTVAETRCLKIFGKNWFAYSFEPGSKFLDRVNITIDKESIINTFKEIFHKFRV